MNANAIERPPLHLIDDEADALSSLALRVEHSQPDVAALLFAEIDRAEIHTADTLPANTIAMNARVTFVDEGSGSRREVQLVYPQDADIANGRVSILTPVGAGLIGLSEGQSITWPDRDGNPRRLRIEKVRAPAEEEG
ncbi:MAG TPA: nucleoside diphosphate kinase regulator [Sphingomonas sp.]|nr:nucleoside diphosphate kinase regulator [Sphingomonas sp.]